MIKSNKRYTFSMINGSFLKHFCDPRDAQALRGIILHAPFLAMAKLIHNA